MSSSELKITGYGLTLFRFDITLESLTIEYEKIASPENCPDVTAIVFKLFCFSLSLRNRVSLQYAFESCEDPAALGITPHRGSSRGSGRPHASALSHHGAPSQFKEGSAASALSHHCGPNRSDVVEGWS